MLSKCSMWYGRFIPTSELFALLLQNIYLCYRNVLSTEIFCKQRKKNSHDLICKILIECLFFHMDSL